VLSGVPWRRGREGPGVCQDMSEACLAGSLKYLPTAEITFDRYHIRKHLSEAIDEVHRAEPKQHKQLLNGTRYLWLKRPGNLTVRQDLLDELLHQPLDTVRAYEFSLPFDEFYGIDDPDAAEEYLLRWIAEVRASELEPLHEFADTLEAHWEGVLRWHHSRINNYDRS
jgi:transposase